jgi:Collagen triple helix repeat (20 copies)
MARRAGAYLRRNHVSLLALFIALGGTSYAAVALPANSVGSKQLQRGAVTKAKLAKSVKASLRGPRGRAGAAGAAGQAGQKGDSGIKGDTGAQGVPGPTAAAWASTGTSQAIPFNGGPADMVHADLVLPFRGRILAHGALSVGRPAANGSVTCRLQAAAAPYADGDFVDIGRPMGTYEPGSMSYQTALPVTGSVTEPAGSYRIRAACNSGAGGTFFEGDLDVIAVPQ